MKCVIVIFAYLMVDGCRSADTALPTVDEIVSGFKAVYTITNNIAKFSTYYPPKDLETQLDNLLHFEKNLTAFATWTSSVNQIWKSRNLKSTEIKDIVIGLRSFAPLLKAFDGSEAIEETRLVASAAQKLKQTDPKDISIVKNFYAKTPSAYQELITEFERLVVTDHKSDDDWKKSLEEALECGNETISEKAKNLLNWLHSYITSTMFLNHNAMLPELYRALNKSDNRASLFPKFAELNMFRAIVASLLAQFCIDDVASTNVPVAEASARKAATMVNDIFIAITDLAMALEESVVANKVNSHMSNLLSGVVKTIQDQVGTGEISANLEIQLHQNLTGLAKMFWESLNTSFGGDTNFGVYLTQNGDTSIVTGEEVFVGTMKPFKVIVHWTPKSRRTGRVMSEYYNLFTNAISNGAPCKNDGSADADWANLRGDEIETILIDTIPLLTNNKIPFILVTNVLYEYYGENAFHDEACFRYDIFIGV